MSNETQTPANNGGNVPAESNVIGSQSEVLSPKQEVVKAIASWALAAFAEEVTRQTGKLAGTSYEDLKTYRKVLGITEGPARVVVANDRKTAAEKEVKTLRERLNVAFMADDSPERDAELNAVRPLLKAAVVELADAEKVDTAASTLRSLELNCTGGQPYSFSSKKIADIAKARYEGALTAVKGIDKLETVGAEVAAAIANYGAYETLLARDVTPIKTKALLAMKEAAQAETLAAYKAAKETAKEAAQAAKAQDASKETIDAATNAAAKFKVLGTELAGLDREVKTLTDKRDAELREEAAAKAAEEEAKVKAETPETVNAPSA